MNEARNKLEWKQKVKEDSDTGRLTLRVERSQKYTVREIQWVSYGHD